MVGFIVFEILRNWTFLMLFGTSRVKLNWLFEILPVFVVLFVVVRRTLDNDKSQLLPMEI